VQVVHLTLLGLLAALEAEQMVRAAVVVLVMLEQLTLAVAVVVLVVLDRHIMPEVLVVQVS
jgi:hypothetical protein